MSANKIGEERERQAEKAKRDRQTYKVDVTNRKSDTERKEQNYTERYNFLEFKTFE